MSEFPDSYEDFIASNNTRISYLSEIDFYKDGYKNIVKLLESNMQELHELKNKNKILEAELIDRDVEIEKYRDDFEKFEYKIDKLTQTNKIIEKKFNNSELENENLKVQITQVKKENDNMITVEKLEKILDAKLSKIENNIISELKSNEIRSESDKEKDVIPTFMSSSTSIDEPKDMTINECKVWWCPKHSDFGETVKKVKPILFDDVLAINRAKSRFNYWSKGNFFLQIRCCTLDRKRTNNKEYPIPSCWPSSNKILEMVNTQSD